jgi:hypothetical protein
LAACTAVSFAAKPLVVTLYCAVGLTPVARRSADCWPRMWLRYRCAALLRMSSLAPCAGRVACIPATPPAYVATGGAASVTM